MDNATDSIEQKERALFEAHMREDGWGGWSLSRSVINGLYADGGVQRFWKVWNARALLAQRAAPTAQPAATISPGDHDFPVDLVEKIRNASSIMGIATDESLEGCSVKLKSILYSLCRAIDRMRESLNAPTAQGSGKDVRRKASYVVMETGLPEEDDAAAAPQEAPQQEPVAWMLRLPDGRLETESIYADKGDLQSYIENDAIPGCTMEALYASPISTISAKETE